MEGFGLLLICIYPPLSAEYSLYKLSFICSGPSQYWAEMHNKFLIKFYLPAYETIQYLYTRTCFWSADSGE